MNVKHVDLPESGIHLYESKHQDGDVVQMHSHPVHQILYAIEGKGRITLGGSTGEFARDHAAVIVPRTEHAIVSDSSLTVLVLAFREQAAGQAVPKELLGEAFPASEMIELNPFAGSELRRLLRRMLFEQLRADALTDWALRIHLQEILLVLARSKQPIRASDANSLRAERIRSYIDTHYFEHLTAKDLASKLGIGVRQVNNIFKEQYRMTPMQYLTEVRMDVAKRLLSETDKTIASVCFEVGYETLSSFYRSFKNAVKLSPNQYRQMVLNRPAHQTVPDRPDHQPDPNHPDP